MKKDLIKLLSAMIAIVMLALPMGALADAIVITPEMLAEDYVIPPEMLEGLTEEEIAQFLLDLEKARLEEQERLAKEALAAQLELERLEKEALEAELAAQAEQEALEAEQEALEAELAEQEAEDELLDEETSNIEETEEELLDEEEEDLEEELDEPEEELDDAEEELDVEEDPEEEPVDEEPEAAVGGFEAAEEETEEPAADPEEETEEPVADPEEETEEPAADPEEETEEPAADPEEETEEPAADPEEETEEPAADPEEETEEPAADPEEETEEQTEVDSEEEIVESEPEDVDVLPEVEDVPLDEVEEYETPMGAFETQTIVIPADAVIDVREAGDGLSPIFVSLEEGAEITVIGIEGDWAVVMIGDQIGYIYIDDIADQLVLPEVEEPETEEIVVEKKVTIFTSRRSVMKSGETVELTSKLEGFEDCEVIEYQWECDKGEGFEKVPGANADTYTFTANKMSLSYDWRLRVSYH